jgi:TRAP-type uncharacterized transport system fused permease subunit
MWLTIGLVIGAGLLALVIWMRRRKIPVAWYDWLFGILGLLLLLFTIQNFTASFAEYEPHAAWNFLWVFGIPAILLITIAFLLPWLRYRKTE